VSSDHGINSSCKEVVDSGQLPAPHLRCSEAINSPSSTPASHPESYTKDEQDVLFCEKQQTEKRNTHVDGTFEDDARTGQESAWYASWKAQLASAKLSIKTIDVRKPGTEVFSRQQSQSHHGPNMTLLTRTPAVTIHVHEVLVPDDGVTSGQQSLPSPGTPHMTPTCSARWVTSTLHNETLLRRSRTLPGRCTMVRENVSRQLVGQLAMLNKR
jgi:hypothetical protein